MFVNLYQNVSKIVNQKYFLRFVTIANKVISTKFINLKWNWAHKGLKVNLS